MTSLALEIAGTNVELAIASTKFALDLSETKVGTGESEYARKADVITDLLIYFGEAAPGTTSSSPLWRISKLVVSNDAQQDVTITWASGNANFDKVWDDRLLLIYS